MKVHGFDDTIKWYDDNSEKYSEDLYKSIPLDSVDEFMKYIPPDAYILEAGCGPGRETKIFTQKGIKTTGIDLSEGLLKIAKKNNPNTEYIKGNFLDTPFEDETFDGVWSHASLVHLEDINDVKKALKEFFRITKKGGFIFVKVKEQAGEKKTAVVTDTLSNHDRFFRYYIAQELVELVTKEGFRVVSNLKREDGHGRPEVQWLEVIAKKP